MKASNEKEFKALIKKYESITINDLEDHRLRAEPLHRTLKLITGFGSATSCTLCKKASEGSCEFPRCDKCVYGIVATRKDDSHFCCDYENELSYDLIYYADTFELLLTAVKVRAEHMKTVWKSYLKVRNK